MPSFCSSTYISWENLTSSPLPSPTAVKAKADFFQGSYIVVPLGGGERGMKEWGGGRGWLDRNDLPLLSGDLPQENSLCMSISKQVFKSSAVSHSNPPHRFTFVWGGSEMISVVSQRCFCEVAVFIYFFLSAADRLWWEWGMRRPRRSHSKSESPVVVQDTRLCGLPHHRLAHHHSRKFSLTNERQALPSCLPPVFPSFSLFFTNCMQKIKK